MYLEVKRAIQRDLEEVRKMICTELSVAIGACRDCRRHIDIFNLIPCDKRDVHGKRCLAMHYRCGCTAGCEWHITKREVGNLVLEAAE